MRAVVQDRYGPPEVLRIEELDRPVPAADELLVRVHASTVNQTDTHFRGATQPLIRLITGMRRPRVRIAGREFAGVVEAIGPAVTKFAVGDRVFGIRIGANADYLCVRETRIVATIPSGLSFAEAAAIPDGGYQGIVHLTRAGVGPGTELLVYGASGSCGTAAVQIGKAWGARVTAVTSTGNLDLLRSLGADEVIDYRTTDFTDNGTAYDVILDAVGKLSFSRTRGSLKPGALWVATDDLRNLLWWAWTSRSRRSRLVFAAPRFSREQFLTLRALVESGRYRGVIDRSYPLEDVVEAHRYVETWRKRGNVVLTVVPEGALG